jgi:hypothetical protein
MSKIKVELTPNQVRVLMLVLSVDLDALGLERTDQAAVRATRTVLQKAGEANANKA